MLSDEPSDSLFVLYVMIQISVNIFFMMFKTDSNANHYIVPITRKMSAQLHYAHFRSRLLYRWRQNGRVLEDSTNTAYVEDSDTGPKKGIFVVSDALAMYEAKWITHTPLKNLQDSLDTLRGIQWWCGREACPVGILILKALEQRSFLMRSSSIWQPTAKIYPSSNQSCMQQEAERRVVP